MTPALSHLLAKSKELREAATPGRWMLAHSRTKKWARIYVEGDGLQMIAEPPSSFFRGRKHLYDFEFIVHARNVEEAKDKMIEIMVEELKDIATDSIQIGWRAERALKRVEEIARGLE